MTRNGGWGPGCGAITHGVWRDLGRESRLKYCPRDLSLTACFSPITLVTVVINLVHLSLSAWQAEYQGIHVGPGSGHSQPWPLCGLSGPFPHFEIPSVPLFFILKNIYCLFGCLGSQLWHSGSLVVACELLVAACGT